MVAWVKEQQGGLEVRALRELGRCGSDETQRNVFKWKGDVYRGGILTRGIESLLSGIHNKPADSSLWNTKTDEKRKVWRENLNTREPKKREGTRRVT